MATNGKETAAFQEEQGITNQQTSLKRLEHVEKEEQAAAKPRDSG